MILLEDFRLEVVKNGGLQRSRMSEPTRHPQDVALIYYRFPGLRVHEGDETRALMEKRRHVEGMN